MQFTKYDYLVTYQYKIINAIKNGFPDSCYYNDWVKNEILPEIISYQSFCDYPESAIYNSGVYQLGSYYIGKTSKPIILRVLEHLFETIPTQKKTDHYCNIEKILCTKIDLLMDNELAISVLSDNPDDEEEIIRSVTDQKYHDIVLTNKQFNNIKRKHTEYLFNSYYDKGIFPDPQEYIDIQIKTDRIYNCGYKEGATSILRGYEEGTVNRVHKEENK